MPKPRTLRKAKRTFSLSRDVLSYLESVRREKKASLSSTLEDIVRQQQQAKEMERVAASITGYYDSISDEERSANRAWGAFAESQFPRDGES